jgi:hypothetical protein
MSSPTLSVPGAPRRRPFAEFLFLALLSWCAFGLMAGGLKWQSDDRQHVFGIGLIPMLPLSDALRLGGSGELSPARMINGPYLGYIGHYLGEGVAHLYLVGWHTLAVWLLLVLLRRLGMGDVPSLLAAAFFCVSPWMSQSIYWWVAGGTTLEACMILVSALLYLNYSDRRIAGKSLAIFSLGLSLLLQFASRSVYESFLAGPALFLGMELVRGRSRGLGWFASLRQALWLAWPTLLPYLAWVIWFKLAPTNNTARQPVTNPLQLLKPTAAVYARAIQWPLIIQWRNVLPNGALALLTPLGIVSFLALLASAALLLRSWAAGKLRGNLDPGTVGLFSALLLAFSVYTAGRFAFVMGGGIDLHTRHHYGGSMGIAIAVAAVISALACLMGNGGRKVLTAACAALLLVLTLACVGVGRHHVVTTQAEQQTFNAILADLPTFTPDTVVIVLGSPPEHGEFPYFKEWDGAWIDLIIRQKVPTAQAFALRQYSLDRDKSTLSFTAQWRGSWGPPLYLNRYQNLDGPGSLGQMISHSFPLSRIRAYQWTPEGITRVNLNQSQPD